MYVNHRRVLLDARKKSYKIASIYSQKCLRNYWWGICSQMQKEKKTHKIFHAGFSEVIL